MLAMETSSRYSRTSQFQAALKQRRSGYEPSDTESEWQESPWRDFKDDVHTKNGVFATEWEQPDFDAARNTSHLSRNQRHSSKLDIDLSSPVRASKTSPVRRKNSKSPYKPRRDDGNVVSVVPIPGSNMRRNTSSFSEFGGGRISPFKTRREEPDIDNDEFKRLNRRQSDTLTRKYLDPELNETHPQLLEASRVGKKSSYSHRSVSAPKQGAREREQPINFGPMERKGARSPSPLSGGREQPSNFGPTERQGGRSPSPLSGGREQPSNFGPLERKGGRSPSPLSRERKQPINFGPMGQKGGRSTSPLSREREQPSNIGPMERKGSRNPSPLSRNLIRKQTEVSHNKGPSASELNEMFANAKLSQGPISDVQFESTESSLNGDIFFSRDYMALNAKKNAILKNGSYVSNPASQPKIISGRDTTPHQRNQLNGSFDQHAPVVSSINVLSRTSITSSSALSRHNSSKISTASSKMSDGSGMTSGSFRKFTANRQRSQTDSWFGCVRKVPCRTSKSPESRGFDEAAFIEKAFVVENLRQFWADKHQPSSLSGFTCHKQQAQLLKQLISHQNCPHILFKGPSGSGKKALTMALLREIYGDPAWNISHDLQCFHIQEKRPIQVIVPLTSSPHHVELNLRSESKNATYALMALVKDITSNHAIAPEVSEACFKADYKVFVLHEADKIAENIQHLIKWIMDCYSDACKIILCCEDDLDLLESLKSRCEVIAVDAPVTHEIMEVLIQIARKENFDLSMSFAAKIATKSKQNLRKAIMALEACKAHNYPFVDEQPIPLGWEEVLVELVAEILADPSPRRLFFIRGKFQKLLVDFVHPKLILLKLVEQFLKGVDASLKRELYYWHAYYDKRLPEGTSALLKLEEFVAKVMSIYRRASAVAGILS